jgi:transposase-like protein
MEGSDTNVKHAITPSMVSQLGKVKPPEVLRMALQLYLEGLSFRGIDRIGKVRHVKVIRWVRRWGRAIEAKRKEAKPREGRM